MKPAAEALGMRAHADSTAEQLIDEMLEFGLSLTLAELLAPMLLPYVNDPRGLAEALRGRSPAIAERLGLLRRN